MTGYLDVVFPHGWPRHSIPLCVSEVDKKCRATEEAGQGHMIVTVGFQGQDILCVYQDLVHKMLLVASINF